MKNFRLILAITIAVSLAPAFGQTAIFVSTSGNDSNNGATWETAKATLAGALTAATGDTHIYMMVGNYVCNDLVIPNGVTVTGGYIGQERQYPGTNSNWSSSAQCTRLIAYDSSRVLTVNVGGVLEGCVLTRGRVSDMGGGVLIDGGTVQHCVLMNNYAISDSDQSAKGGGAYIRNNGYLLNCVVTQNCANNGPGVAGTDGTLTNNTIANNYVYANCGTVTDYDGNVYPTIVIGSQCWMKENLRSTHYADGADIPSSTSSSSTVGYRRCPNQDCNNVSTYGYLYNWPAVMRGYDYTPTITTGSINITPPALQGICPTGWHVPSYNEWNTLVNYVKAQPAYRCDNSTNNVAKALASKVGWYTDSFNYNSCSAGYSQSSNNRTDFSAMPAGRYPTGSVYTSFGQGAYFWARNYCFYYPGNGTTAYNVATTDLNYNGAVVNVRNGTSGYENNRSYFNSVRCVRD